jgi:SPP1 gp7 family putative phage head morphogenesis protein
MATKAGEVPPPKASETAYRSSLYRYLNATWRRMKGDPYASLDDLFDAIAIKSVDEMLKRVNVYNMRKVLIGLERIGALQQVKAVAADVNQALALARVANVDLIRNITQQQRDFARQELAKVDDPTPLASRLQAKLGFSRSRAKLVARDQVSKINGTLSEQRHKAAGAEKYEWSTSSDERVRPEHAALDGQQFAYDDPDGGDGGLKPGQAVSCRCVGLAVFD